jgi:hypothetical protein
VHGVEHNDPAGQRWDRPLAHREPALHLSDVRGGHRRRFGAALDRLPVGGLELLAQHPTVGGHPERRPGERRLGHRGRSNPLLRGDPTLVGVEQPGPADQVRGDAGQVHRGPPRPGGVRDRQAQLLVGDIGRGAVEAHRAGH